MLKQNWKIIILSILLFTVSCSSDKTTVPPIKPGGIVINYYTDKFLNPYDGHAHSLMLAVYQMDNINAFHQLANTTVGIQNLLTLNKFDASVMGIDSKFVYPDESGVITLDRMENTKWIGIVAGYYNLNPILVVKQYQIPQNSNKPLKINLFFSSEAIQEVTNK